MWECLVNGMRWWGGGFEKMAGAGNDCGFHCVTGTEARPRSSARAVEEERRNERVKARSLRDL
uniref:Uncharacterized protein n=1 Tax=Anguilla anguilla TaxID=7936 RepID=A0A0E9TE38_ANGAN